DRARHRCSRPRRAHRRLRAHDVRHTAAAVAAVYGDLLGEGPAAPRPSAVTPTERRESTHP
ncbi:glycosyltransferase family 1 protein, partial [Streptomyces geysiriensis]|nr:glycosyltransferase family 1 protein [Streptomyces geysiriensis]